MCVISRVFILIRLGNESLVGNPYITFRNSYTVWWLSHDINSKHQGVILHQVTLVWSKNIFFYDWYTNKTSITMIKVYGQNRRGNSKEMVRSGVSEECASSVLRMAPVVTPFVKFHVTGIQIKHRKKYYSVGLKLLRSWQIYIEYLWIRL